MRDNFTILVDMADADDGYFRKATGAADPSAAVPFEVAPLAPIPSGRTSTKYDPSGETEGARDLAFPDTTSRSFDIVGDLLFRRPFLRVVVRRGKDLRRPSGAVALTLRRLWFFTALRL